MSFTLTYRQGSFPQSEAFASRLGAVARAYIVLEREGSSNFLICHHGLVVMRQAEIVSECEMARKDVQIGQPPTRLH